MMLGMGRWRRRTRCQAHGHDWFPNLAQSEFLPMTDRCRRGRCGAYRYRPPYGVCVGRGELEHFLAEHYAVNGDVVGVTDWPTFPAEFEVEIRPAYGCPGPA